MWQNRDHIKLITVIPSCVEILSIEMMLYITSPGYISTHSPLLLVDSFDRRLQFRYIGIDSVGDDMNPKVLIVNRKRKIYE
jgi:hypothetical protein